MDTPDLQKQIAERLAALPPEVQNLILAADTGQRIRDIGTQHSLHIDQLGKLEDITMLVMLGLIETAQFGEEVQKDLALSGEDAQKIVGEISEKLFAPIRESMKATSINKPTLEETAVKINTPAPFPPPPTPSVTLPTTPSSVSVVTTSIPAVQIPTPPAAPSPTAVPSMPKAEEMLTEKTVVTPIYKADPYREPIE